METVKQTDDCAYGLKKNKGDICMEEAVVDKLKKFMEKDKKIVVKNSIDVINNLKKIYNCKYESCLLKQNEIVDVIGDNEVSNQLYSRFKPHGPYDSTQWFSNVNIDKVLDQIADKFKHKKFLHIEFQMRDFADTGGTLSRIDLAEEYNKGMRCFGVVFNTDKSSGSGEHWFSIFGDLSKEPFTIEYFNSAGGQSYDDLPEISLWMKDTRNYLCKKLSKKAIDVVVTSIVNQSDNHSCGSYSLYYILSRLEGTPYKYFEKNKIGDKLMHEFRFNLFRKEK